MSANKSNYDFGHEMGVIAAETAQIRKDVTEIKGFLLENGLVGSVAGLKSSVVWLRIFVMCIMGCIGGIILK